MLKMGPHLSLSLRIVSAGSGALSNGIAGGGWVALVDGLSGCG
jgi:hypothetical protein